MLVDVVFSEIWRTLDSYYALPPKKFLRAARSVMSCDPIDVEDRVIGASPYDCDVIAREIKRFADEKFAQFVPPMGSDWYLEKVKAYYRDALTDQQYLSASELCALISIGKESEARARCEKAIKEFREGPGWPKPTGGFQLSSGETFIDMALAHLTKSAPRQ